MSLHLHRRVCPICGSAMVGHEYDKKNNDITIIFYCEKCSTTRTSTYNIFYDQYFHH